MEGEMERTQGWRVNLCKDGVGIKAGIEVEGIMENGVEQAEANPKKNMVLGPYAGVDYNLTCLTLSRLQSRLQHMNHEQPYARVDLNPFFPSINAIQE